MLKGFGIATITLGIISAVTVFVLGIIKMLSDSGMFALMPVIYGLLLAIVIVIITVGNGLMMIRIDQMHRAQFSMED